MKKIKRYFPIFYVALLFFGFLYVRDILSEESIDVDRPSPEKEAIEVKPVNVYLTVRTSNFRENYQARMENTNTFDDLLEHLRDNTGFYFEKTEYIYGTEYEEVSNIRAPEGYTWRVYENGEEITYQTPGHELVDDAEYEIVLEPET